MNNFITLYREVIGKEFCENLISKFEKYSTLHESKENILKDEHWKMKFTQLNISQNCEFSEEKEILNRLFLDAISSYKKEHNIQEFQWPNEFSLEPIRMKRYLPNSDDSFDPHVDVGDYNSARRFLVLFLYLNDDFNGGETDFPQFQINVKPRQGNMILFPSMWAWWHKANPVRGANAKYIVGTYMHYRV